MTKRNTNHQTSAMIVDLYGEDAYQAYLLREAQIKKMAHDAKRWPPLEIAHLHEQNWKLLKQQVTQPWFAIDFYGKMVPSNKALPTSNLDLRSAV